MTPPPNWRNMKNKLGTFLFFQIHADFGLIRTFSLRLFHSLQFIKDPPQLMIFHQKFSNPSQLFMPPYYYGRENTYLTATGWLENTAEQLHRFLKNVGGTHVDFRNNNKHWNVESKGEAEMFFCHAYNTSVRPGIGNSIFIII